MNYEFTTLVDIHKEDKEGIPFLWKSGVKIKLYGNTELIEGVSQVVGKNGQVLKRECKIIHAAFGEVNVKHGYEEMKQLFDRNEPTRIKGY